MRILALDVGYKNTGIAISNVECTLIYPLSVIKMDKFNGGEFFRLLKDNLKKYWGEIDSVVIGNGSYSEKVNPIVKIVNQVERILRSWTDWRVISVGEVNSSVAGNEFLKNIGTPREKRIRELDSYAALIILKEYFESLNREVLVSF